MKTQFIATFALVCSFLPPRMSAISFTATEERHFKECLKDTTVDETVLEKFAKDELVDDDNLKEVLFCISKKAGYQNADGSFNMDVVKKAVAEDAGSAMFDAELEKCAMTEVHGGPANAFAMMKCFLPIYVKIHNKDE